MSRRIIEPKLGMPDLSASLRNPGRNADSDKRHQQNHQRSGKKKRPAHNPNPERDHRNSRIRVKNRQPGVGQMCVIVKPGAPIAIEHIEDSRVGIVARCPHEHTRARCQRDQHQANTEHRALAKHRGNREHHKSDHQPGDGKVVQQDMPVREVLNQLECQVSPQTRCAQELQLPSLLTAPSMISQ